MVTPCVGVWIETIKIYGDSLVVYVTPCVGVWIETAGVLVHQTETTGHTLRGCVD